jgi:uncharacterized membrane protein YhaH (DUF805 family)
MFKAPFSFEGRIRRMEFGVTMIIYMVVYFGIMALMASAGDVGAIAAILFIPMVWFIWAQGAKRCHDIGKSGWWQLIPFYVFVMLFQDGDKIRNEYGSSPKYPDQGVDVLSSETLDGHMKS